MKFIPTIRLTGAVVISLCLFAVSSQPVSSLSAGDWRPGRIIDDAIFYNKSSMTIGQIQQYLNARMPTCDNWGTEAYGTTTRRAYSESRGVTFPLTCLRDYHENTTTHE